MKINSKSKIEDLFDLFNLPIDTPILYKNYDFLFELGGFKNEEHIDSLKYFMFLFNNNKRIIQNPKGFDNVIHINYDRGGFYKVEVGYYGNFNMFIKNNVIGPAEIRFHHNNNNINYLISEIRYYLDGKFNRFSKPAYIIYNRYGMIVEEYFYLNGKLHNPIGPAYRKYRNNEWKNGFYLNSFFITSDVFFRKRKYSLTFK